MYFCSTCAPTLNAHNRAKWPISVTSDNGVHTLLASSSVRYWLECQFKPRRRAFCTVFLFFLLYIFLFSTYFIFVKIYLNKSSTFVTLSYYFICNFIFKLPVLAIDVYKFLFFYILFHTFRKWLFLEWEID